MSKTIVIAGYGPGISEGMARKFGAEGFQVALVSRTAEKVNKAAAALGDAKIKAKGYAVDLGDANAVQKLIADVRRDLGPITVLHWNGYALAGGNALTATVDELRKPFEVGVLNLIVAVQAALPDLKAQKDSAVLITGGGFAFYDPNVDAAAAQYDSMALAISKAAQHKAAGVLHQKLKSEGVYVGEVVIAGTIAGTPWDRGNATLTGAQAADKFWELYRARGEATTVLKG